MAEEFIDMGVDATKAVSELNKLQAALLGVGKGAVFLGKSGGAVTSWLEELEDGTTRVVSSFKTFAQAVNSAGETIEGTFRGTMRDGERSIETVTTSVKNSRVEWFKLQRQIEDTFQLSAQVAKRKIG